MRTLIALILGFVLLLAMSGTAVDHGGVGHAEDGPAVLHVDTSRADHCGDSSAGTPHCASVSALAGAGVFAWPAVFARPLRSTARDNHHAAPPQDPPYRPPAHLPV